MSIHSSHKTNPNNHTVYGYVCTHVCVKGRCRCSCCARASVVCFGAMRLFAISMQACIFPSVSGAEDQHQHLPPPPSGSNIFFLFLHCIAHRLIKTFQTHQQPSPYVPFSLCTFRPKPAWQIWLDDKGNFPGQLRGIISVGKRSLLFRSLPVQYTA